MFYQVLVADEVTERETDRQTNRERQTNRQTDREIERLNYKFSSSRIFNDYVLKWREKGGVKEREREGELHFLRQEYSTTMSSSGLAWTLSLCGWGKV